MTTAITKSTNILSILTSYNTPPSSTPTASVPPVDSYPFAADGLPIGAQGVQNITVDGLELDLQVNLAEIDAVLALTS